MDSTLEFKGDADVMIGQNHGPIIVNNTYASPAEDQRISDPAHRIAIGQLFGLLKKYELKPEMEVVSAALFGGTTFKELSVDQIKQLHVVAKIFNDRLSSLEAHIEDKYDNRDEVDFNRFYKETGMYASTPERAALRLLFKENVTPHQVKIVRSELLLDYKDDNQISLKAPIWRACVGWPIAAFSLLMFASSMFAAKIVALTYKAPPFEQGLMTLVFIVITVGAAAISAYQAGSFLKPYLIAKRIMPYVEKVNLKLKKQG